MKKIFNHILDIGISSATPKNDKKPIRLLNTYSLIWFFFQCFYVILDIATGVFDEKLATAHFGTISFIIITVSLNYFNYHLSARYLFVLTIFLNFNLFSLWVNPGSYLEYYFVLLAPISISILRDKYVNFGIFLLSVFSFFIPYFIYPQYPIEIISKTLPAAILGIFLANYFLIRYFKKENYRSELLLEKERDIAVNDKALLQKQEEELRELNEFKSHFFVNISHEIKTPLTLILAYLKQLKNDDQFDQKVNIIKKQANQIQNLIDSILDLSKLDNDSLNLHQEWVPINSFFQHTSKPFYHLYHEKQIDFTIDFPPQAYAIWIDKQLFEKVINNLLSNAYKFTYKAGKVNIQIISSPDSIAIHVIDSGIGIPTEEIPLIFNRFYQVKNNITQSQGSGIGLDFSKRIIDAHGFQISVESSEGTGCTFKIMIPTQLSKKIEHTEDEKITEKPVIKETSIPVKKENTSSILLVEDHSQMREYIHSLLPNYHLHLAENGEIALEILKDNSIDLVITDYMMPVMNGLELVKHIKAKSYKVPIIVLTARSDIESKVEMFRYGVDNYFRKPFLEEEFLHCVHKSIHYFQMIQQFEAEEETQELKKLNAYGERFLEKLTAFLKKNLSSNVLSAESTAKHMKVSKSTLNRKLKVLCGQSFQQFLHEVRSEEAKKLMLENPELSQKEIVSKIGLTNPSRFFRNV